MAAKTEKGAEHVVHVFVYGTLKRTKGNHTLLSQQVGAKFVGHDTITDRFSMWDYGGFPAVCDDPDLKETEVFPMYGEIYAIPPEGLRALDVLEGHPRWYCRRKMRTDINNIRAWMYIMPSEGRRGTKLDIGVWRPSQDEEEWWQKEHGVELGDAA